VVVDGDAAPLEAAIRQAAPGAATPPAAGLQIHSADDYLEGENGTDAEPLTVVNLCRSYQYLSKGYYVSLLAEARHQRVIPTLATIQAISDPYVYFRALEEAGLETIDYRIVRGGRRLLPKAIVIGKGPMISRTDDEAHVRYERTSQPFVEVTSILGRTLDERFRRRCARIFKVYPVPLLGVRFYEDVEEEEWHVGQIFPVALTELAPEEIALLMRELSRERPVARPESAPRPYRIACLWEESDPYAPSDEETLEKFERAAERQGALFEIIEKDDLPALAEYDALFIRTVTGVDHYAFTFSRTAESLDIPVIDDPASIMRCSNKVFLHELFEKHGIATPRTAIVSRKTAREEVASLPFPVIVKLPDGTFSHAVKKAANPAEFEALTQEMFRKSPLLIVQEFIPTPFDWRIGVLEGRLLYAARYHMVKDHWQIVGRFKTGRPRYGKVEAVALDAVPQAVRSMALDAAALIGDGLYGVDLKETPDGPRVIEINDNPNILETDEDAVEKDRLYDAVISALLRRIRERDEPVVA
jgi:glutathione synthase/RimK-type ligase-like ATP-grasp enzyme